jgi:hypothetical protein
MENKENQIVQKRPRRPMELLIPEEVEPVQREKETKEDAGEENPKQPRPQTTIHRIVLDDGEEEQDWRRNEDALGQDPERDYFDFLEMKEKQMDS